MNTQLRRHGNLQIAVLASAISAVLAGTGAVQAQEAEPEQEPALEEVTVTGSRIARRDFIANSPIMTLEAARFEESSTIAMESVLNQMPQFVPAVTQFQTVPNQTGLLSNDGDPGVTPSAATLSLRGLGSNRNLVLIDGRRAMPIDASMAVDINGIPSAAVARVETITGGASSVYGADAVAGVVNFVLKTDFEGFDLNAQYGITEEGDAEEQTISTLFGANFGDRSNVLIGMERYERGQVLQQDRDFYTDGWADTGSQGGLQVFYTAPYISGNPGNPFSREALDTVFADAPPGSVNTFGNFYFNNDGTVYKRDGSAHYRYNGPTLTDDGRVYRFVRDDNNQLSENWVDQQHSAPLSRNSLFGRARTELTDNVSAIGQLMLAESDSQHRERIAGMVGGWGGSVPHGNDIYEPSVGPDGNTLLAYQPGGRLGLNCGPVGGCTKSEAWPKSPDAQLLLDSRPNPEAPVNVGTATPWFGNQRNNVTTLSYQFLTGIEGRLPERDWTWELYFSRGASTTQNEYVGTTSTQRWRFVINQPNYGTGLFQVGNQDGGGFGAGFMECTSGFAFLGQQEIYYHPGAGISNATPSQDCMRATGAVFSVNGRLTQSVTEFNIQGDLVEMPAGPLQFALGASDRENNFRWFAPPISAPESVFDLAAGQYPRSETSGTIAATEIYGELLVPLLSNRPFAQTMNLELGFRRSDNDPTESVDSYKALLDWQIHERVRIRGGHQVANRAPNVAELYQNEIMTLFVGTQGDWCSDLNPVNPLSPNPALNPNAAQVRQLCSELMTPTGASVFYDDPNRSNRGLNFIWAFVEGNPNIRHETAGTTTIGVVADVTDRITLTADYWQIKINDMISAQDPNGIYQQCLSPVSNPSFDPNFAPCTQAVRDPFDGGQSVLSLLFTNEGAADFSGYDVTLNWNSDVGPGLLSVDATVTIADETRTRVSPDSDWTDWTGTSGPGDLTSVTGWTFDYRTFVTTNYSFGPWSATLRWRHLPSIDSEGTVGNPNHTFEATNSYNIFDVAGRYSPGGNWDVRFGIDNLFSADPERTFPDAGNTATGQTNANFFDILGRRYYVGLRLQF